MYTLRETDLFQAQSARICEVRYIDEALSVLTFMISKNPDEFEYVPGFSPIRMAKSDVFIKDSITVPRLRVWFRAVEENTIELMAIETFNE
jgi:hypothetical protein